VITERNNVEVGAFRSGWITLLRNVWLNVMSLAKIFASLDRSKIFSTRLLLTVLTERIL